MLRRASYVWHQKGFDAADYRVRFFFLRNVSREFDVLQSGIRDCYIQSHAHISPQDAIVLTPKDQCRH